MRIMKYILVLAALCGGTVVHAQPQLTLKRTAVDWPEISVFYEVLCSNRLEVAHTPANITLTEDGIPVASYTKYCPDTTTHCAMSAGLVFDASGPTVGKWHAAQRNAGRAFISKMNGGSDEAALVFYNTFVTVEQAMTSDTTALQSAMATLFPVGGNAMYDGIFEGMQQVLNSGVNSCRTVVVSAFDADNLSNYTEQDVIDVARANELRIITVGLGFNFDAGTMQRMADSTGGRYFRVLDTLNLQQTYREIYELISDEFRECVLRFDTDCEDGAYHDISLEIENVCSGSDSTGTRVIHPFATGHERPLDIVPATFEAFAGTTIELQYGHVTLNQGILQPANFIITFPRTVLKLLSVKIPRGSPLEGTEVDIIPFAQNYLLATKVAVDIGSPGSFFNLEFEVLDRQDSTSVLVTPLSASVQKGCLTPTMHTGRINIAIPPRPVIEALGLTAFCPGDSVTLRVTEEYDGYLWTTGDTTRSITVKEGKNYAVTVMDHAGRSAISPVFPVTVHPGAHPQLSQSGSVALCAGSSLTLGTKESYMQYQWSTGDTTATIAVADSGMYVVAVIDSNGCAGVSDTLSVTVQDPVVTIQPSDTALLCMGDTLLLTADAGFVHYRWNNGRATQQIFVTQPGNYVVRITNAAGCTAWSDTVVVVEVPLPDAEITTQGPMTICPGDSLALNGTPGFVAYHWSTGETTPSIRVHNPGLYTLRVTNANGCTSVADSVYVGITQRPKLEPGGTHSICFGESLVMDAGEGYVAYQWSTGLEGRTLEADTSGSYWVDVTDAGGCTLRSDTVVLFVRPEIKPEITADGPLTFCDGGSVALNAPLGFRGYEWSSGELSSRIVVQRSGTYSVKVFGADDCTGTSEPVDVTVLPLPPKPVVTVQGASLTTTSAHGYQWLLDGIPIPMATKQNHTAAHSGMYSVRVFNADSCSSISDEVQVTLSGIESAPTSFKLQVYPDPNHGEFTIEAIADVPLPLHVSVVNMLGQRVAVFEEQRAEGTVRRSISLQHVPSGVYLLRVRLGMEVITRRIIRQ
ncbi:MAG: hypothetical protein C0600_11095 [Ignavibacteria bacterium]|nr:MAG: hypothetical protein C0600_11095 [Ignavibacteria bacterium]